MDDHTKHSSSTTSSSSSIAYVNELVHAGTDGDRSVKIYHGCVKI